MRGKVTKILLYLFTVVFGILAYSFEIESFNSDEISGAGCIVNWGSTFNELNKPTENLSNYSDVFSFYETCRTNSVRPENCISECFKKAGEMYGISPLLLWGIAYVESKFNSGAYRINKNKTVDRGLMQINSSWIPVLKKYGLKDVGYLYHPCYNIFIGAWILRQCIDKYGYSWRAVSCYNTGHPTKGMYYAKKVYNVLKLYSKRSYVYYSSEENSNSYD